MTRPLRARDHDAPDQAHPPPYPRRAGLRHGHDDGRDPRGHGHLGRGVRRDRRRRDPRRRRQGAQGRLRGRRGGRPGLPRAPDRRLGLLAQVRRPDPPGPQPEEPGRGAPVDDDPQPDRRAVDRAVLDRAAPPASGAAPCDPNNAAGTFIDGSNGTFRIRSTGRVSPTARKKRSIIATFRRRNFLNYVYFTDLETSDPAFYVRGAQGLVTRENPRPSPLQQRNVVAWAAEECYVLARGPRRPSSSSATRARARAGSAAARGPPTPRTAARSTSSATRRAPTRSAGRSTPTTRSSSAATRSSGARRPTRSRSPARRRATSTARPATAGADCGNGAPAGQLPRLGQHQPGLRHVAQERAARDASALECCA